MKPLIDVGHGGSDPGAVGNGVTEAEVVLEVSKLTAAMIRAAGIPVGLTRTRDVTLLPANRIQAVTRPGLCIVSIHANAAESAAARGHEVFVSFFDERSRGLGVSISSELTALVLLPPRDPPVKTRLDSQGTGDWYYVIDEPRKVGNASVLVEIGFVTNPDDATYLVGFWGRFQLAYAISRGILRFLEVPDPAGSQPRLMAAEERLQRIRAIVCEEE